MKAAGYWFFRAIAKTALHMFFRRVEAERPDCVPSQGPVILLANHSNALVDPLVVMISQPRRVTFTAKNVLAKKPMLGRLMSWLGVITFHRQQDVGKGASLRANLKSFKQCRSALARGATLCIFPEGISHSDLKLREFRLGPARIAIDFVRKEGNPGGLKIVPVGLWYSDKDRFRSRVWLQFGNPVDVAAWMEANPGQGAAELTDLLQTKVEQLTMNYETRRESVILSWTAEIMATRAASPQALGSAEQPAAEWFELLNRLQKGYRALRESHAPEVEEVTRRIREYRTEIRRCGVTPEEVFLPMHAGRAALFVIREIELVLVGAPMAVFGAVNHLVPYHIVKRLARTMSMDKDQWATNVIYPSLLVFPVWYLAVLSGAWMLLPWQWALVYTAALPLTGYYAILYADRFGLTRRRLSTFLRFLFYRQMQNKLIADGRAIVSRVRELERLLADEPQ